MLVLLLPATLVAVSQSPGTQSAVTAAPVPSRVVATARYKSAREVRKLQLTVVYETLSGQRRESRFRYRITDESVATTGSPDKKMVVDLPDIPTHDRMGAGAPQRSGALFVDSQASLVYAFLLKISGSSAIIRVYEVQIDRAAPKRPAFRTGKQAPIQMEQHLPLSGESVAIKVTESSNGLLQIDLKHAETGHRFKSLTFNRKAKRLHEKTQ